MTERLRVGVVGTSWFAETFHLAGLRSHPRAEINAICSRDRAYAEEVASRNGGPAVFTDYEEMIGSGLLDALVIATPDDLHHDMVLSALASGLHVMCEKPLARTVGDARAMSEAAEAAGRVHMMMLSWRWLGITAFAKRLVMDGYIGRFREASFSMLADYGDDLVDQWRFDPDRGTGILGDLGSHMIDMARWYVGEIVQVSARLVTTDVAGPTPGDPRMASRLADSATVLVEFAGGASGTITVSGARVDGGAPDMQVRLFGDQGSLKLDFGPAHSRLSRARRGDDSWTELEIPLDLLGTGGANPWILDLPSLAPFTNLPVADRLFVDAVLDGVPAEPTFHDGLRVQEIIDAVLTSDRRRCWVAVPTDAIPVK